MALGKEPHSLNPLPALLVDPNLQGCQNDTMFSLMGGSPAVLYSINAINALICFVGLSGNILVVSRTVSGCFFLHKNASIPSIVYL